MRRKWGINLDLGFKTFAWSSFEKQEFKVTKYVTELLAVSHSQQDLIHPDSQQCRCWNYWGQNIQ